MSEVGWKRKGKASHVLNGLGSSSRRVSQPVRLRVEVIVRNGKLVPAQTVSSGLKKIHIHSLSRKVRRIIQQQLARAHRRLIMNRIVHIHEARALLAHRLVRVRVRMTAPHARARRLEQRARALRDLCTLSLHGKQQRARAREERRRHARPALNAVPAELQRQRRQDVPAGRGDGGLEVHVGGGSVGGERGDEAPRAVWEVEEAAGLREGEGDVCVCGELRSKL